MGKIVELSGTIHLKPEFFGMKPKPPAPNRPQLILLGCAVALLVLYIVLLLKS